VNDRLAMERAIELSKLGYPAPNPHAYEALMGRTDGGGGGAHVGCVLVNDGEVVGEGYYKHSGCPHAEVAALQEAQGRARGATAYVTLEPCNHHGRTPPCSIALIAAGVKRVVVACADPNPRAKGGAEHLREEGIPVEFGLMEAEARRANWQFFHAIETGLPAVTLKVAMSLDGRIALPNGDSKWITGEEARAEGHRLRAECGSVLVGRGTVEADDPQLTARLDGVPHQPLRIVLDPYRRLAGTEKAFSPPGESIRVVADAAGEGEILIPIVDGQLDLKVLLQKLARSGVNGVLVEGGAATVSHFLTAGLWDKLAVFIAPKILFDGPTWVRGTAAGSMGEVLEHRIDDVKRLGADVCLTITRAP